MELVKIFIAGGVFCMFGEVLWAKTGLGVVKTLMVCIAAGVALDVAGILGPVIGFGQEGFTVTIYGDVYRNSVEYPSRTKDVMKRMLLFMPKRFIFSESL